MKTPFLLSFVPSFRRVMPLLAAATVLLVSVGGAEAQTARWEYAVVNAKLTNRVLEQMLNDRAVQGWELVQITDRGIAIFKRKK